MPDYPPDPAGVMAPWRFGLGDHIATVNYAITRSWMLGVTVKIATQLHGRDCGKRLREILPLLHAPERCNVKIVDEPHTWEPDGFAIWASPYWPTKTRWQVDHKTRRITYHFDGVSSASDKNPPPSEMDAIVDLLVELSKYNISKVQLGQHMTIKKCVDVLADSTCFIGVDSGMSHLAHCVGVPVFIVEYKLPIVTTHRHKHYEHCRGTSELLRRVRGYLGV